MTNKVQKIRKEVEKLHGNLYYMIAVKDVLKILDMQEKPVDEDFLSLVDKEARELWKEINSGNDFSIVDSFNQFYGICMQVAESTVEWQKNPQEPVSEFLNTESMIESYKQRLISQANGMKNSPLIDMCLASYKHGINETLDTLNLSNVERIVKNWKEPVSEDLEDAAYSFARKDSKGISNPANFYYIIADKARIFKAGAKWQKEQMMKDAVDAECDVILLEEGDELQYSVLYPKGKKPFNKGDLARLIIVKED